MSPCHCVIVNFVPPRMVFDRGWGHVPVTAASFASKNAPNCTITKVKVKFLFIAKSSLTMKPNTNTPWSIHEKMHQYEVHEHNDAFIMEYYQGRVINDDASLVIFHNNNGRYNH